MFGKPFCVYPEEKKKNETLLKVNICNQPIHKIVAQIKEGNCESDYLSHDEPCCTQEKILAGWSPGAHEVCILSQAI